MTAPATPHPREAGVISNHSHASTVVSFAPSLQHPPTTATPETAV